MNEVNKYVKKPVVIEAIKLTPGLSLSILTTFMGGPNNWIINDNGEININTLEGNMKADIGDYIIKGIKGEYYPCKPDIFEATYEKL